MVNINAGNPGRQGVRQTAAHGAFSPDRIITTVGQISERFGFLGGFVGNEMDQPAGCIAAEQGALRTFQYFHPLHIEIGKQLGLLGRLVNLVHVHGIGRLRMVGEIVLGSAADGKLVTLVAAAAGHGNPRGITGYFDAVGEAQRFHLFSADCGDGNTHILDGLLAFLCRDNDFFK